VLRPTSRLDLLLVPTALDAPPDRGAALIARLREVGAIATDGTPGPMAERWSPHRFARVRLEDPGAVVLWSNRQGGFRVRCPRTGEPIAAVFAAALGAWRAGGPRELACPSCGETHPLEAVPADPAIALGPWAIATIDIDGTTLSAGASRWIEEAVGDVSVVLRRG
jgi:hypothetical protein